MRNPGLEPGSLAALEPESASNCAYRQFLIIALCFTFVKQKHNSSLKVSNWKRVFQAQRRIKILTEQYSIDF
jgi:hypothetical protein